MLGTVDIAENGLFRAYRPEMIWRIEGPADAGLDINCDEHIEHGKRSGKVDCFAEQIYRNIHGSYGVDI